MKKKPKKPARRKPSKKPARKPARAARRKPTSAGALAPRQLALPHVPAPKPGAHTPEELRAVTVQTLRVGRLRADRWQLAASNERRPWAVWASIALDAACDALGLPALPKGAR